MGEATRITRVTPLPEGLLMRFPRARLLAPLAVGVALVLSACSGGTWTGSDGSKVAVNCPGLPTAQPTAVVSGACSWGYTPPTTTTVPPTTTTTVPPTTTTTVPPTTTTTPPVTTTTTVTPPPPGSFPTLASTGAPAGTTFTDHIGDFTITSSGTYNALHVTGTLYVNAPNVVVTNSWVGGNTGAEEAVVNNSTGLKLSYTTVGNGGCNPQPGVGEHDYTADHVKITGMGDGFRVSGNNVNIQDSYVQTCDDPNNHDDGMQAYCPGFVCNNITVNHSYLSVANTQNYTAPLFGGVGASNGQISNGTFTNNLLNGGVFTVYLQWNQGPNLVITGNRLVNKSWTYASSSTQGTCPHITWSDNATVTIDGNNQPTSTPVSVGCIN